MHIGQETGFHGVWSKQTSTLGVGAVGGGRIGVAELPSHPLFLYIFIISPRKRTLSASNVEMNHFVYIIFADTYHQID